MKAIFVMPFNHSFAPVNDSEGGDGVTCRSRVGHVPHAVTCLEYIKAPAAVIAAMQTDPRYVFVEEIVDAEA